MSTETSTTDNRSESIAVHTARESTDRRASSERSSSNTDRRTGRVKWFGKGYGFVIDIDDPAKEYFVHHSALVVTQPTEENDYRIYKRLEKGEYIECSIYRDNDGRDCADDVTGIRRGPLMCETNPSSHTRRQPKRRYDRDDRNNRDDRDDRDYRDNHRRRSRSRRRDRRRRSTRSNDSSDESRDRSRSR